MEDQYKKYREFTKEERQWVGKLKKLMQDKACSNLFMFIGSGSMVIYTTDDEKGVYMTNMGGVDDNAPRFHVQTKIECDGGDW